MSPATGNDQINAEPTRRTFTMNACSLLPSMRPTTFWRRFSVVEPTGPEMSSM